jgi:hypothetical protein
MPAIRARGLSKWPKLASWVEKPAVEMELKAWQMASNQFIPARR